MFPHRAPCGHEKAISGAGGGQQAADQYDIGLIAQRPLDRSIRENADSGRPSVVADPASRANQAYFHAARRTGARLAQQEKDYAGKFPNIKVENS